MKLIRLCTLLLFLRACYQTELDLPFGLNKEQVDTLFNNFLWSLAQNDSSRTIITQSNSLPFGLTIDIVGKVYASFMQSLIMTSEGSAPQLQGIQFRFNKPIVNRVVNQVVTVPMNQKVDNSINQLLNMLTPNQKQSNNQFLNRLVVSQPTEFFFPSFANIPAQNISQQTDYSGMASNIFQLLNDFRVQNGLKPLKWSDPTSKRALTHSQYMAQQGKISHDNFEKRADGCSYANENVAFYGGYSVDDAQGAQMFMNLWINSPGHNKNMKAVEPSMTGIAVYKDVEKNRYFSCMINMAP